ncbi:TIGR03747 family integrating conjugative element membrane protein [Phocoenobacter skyensis]|uniref:TIGR03747 family integrating conjugative element membrane protein n=1 Tax=Phocoenobacter skyensis TaxID=97481 RepID=UPI00274C290B|nr:TIGR03747 family integrating conjugative element membrane protein [Pasteurella skyensis]MDP8185314.1 TIGR03747 family integrating conjugative element membrane protein [Pasteurella skyensis]
MTEQANSTQRKSKKGVLHLFSALFAALFISLILSIFFEWVGISFFWPEQGHLHSQKMMLTELNWLSDSATRSFFALSPKELAESIALATHDILFVKTGLQSWFSHPENYSSWERWIYHYGQAYIKSIVYIIIVFLVRLVVVIFTSPLFILAAFAGVTEGLMLRDLRKFGAGRESSFLYHRARKFITPVMIGSWILYLSIPVSIYPNLILVPAAFLFGLSICITAASFKKYF